jgi:hypothetical protein
VSSSLTRRGASANNPARLPALQAARCQDPAAQQAIEQLREWIEVRLGSRGDRFERAVTFRDLEAALAGLSSAASTPTTTTVTNTVTSDAAGQLSDEIDRLRADTLQALAVLRARVDTLPTSGGSTVDLATVNVWTRNQSTATVNLTDAATIAVDASLSNVFRVTISGDRTLANPTNLTDGMVLYFIVIQDSVGGRVLAFGSKYWFSSDRAIGTAINAVSLVRAVYDGANDRLLCTMVPGYTAVTVPLLLHFDGGWCSLRGRSPRENSGLLI